MNLNFPQNNLGDTSITIDKFDRIIVVNYCSNLILFYESDGTFIKSLSNPNPNPSYYGIGCGNNGQIYISSVNSPLIYIYEIEEEFD